MTLRLDPLKDRALIERMTRKGGQLMKPRVTTGRKLKKTPEELPGRKVNSIMITLDLPPSVNHMYRTGYDDGKRHLSEEGRDYKKRVHLAVRLQKTGWIDGEMAAKITIYCKQWNSDLDDRLKALFDALQGNCYTNDKLITLYEHVEMKIDDKWPRVEVILRRRYDGITAQASKVFTSE